MSYNYEAIVSKSEAEALKEMIFKRVRERAAALNEDVQTSYTTSARFDVMDLARETFDSSKNPFSVKQASKATEETKDLKEPERVAEARKHSDEIRAQIDYRNKIASENIANASMNEAMNEARDSLAKKTSFMGTLEFLNSQATIGLVSKTGSRFRALA